MTGFHHHCLGPVWDRQRSESQNVITVLPLSCSSIPLSCHMDTPGAVWWFSVAPWHVFQAVSCRFETCPTPPPPFRFAFTRQHFHSYHVSRRGGGRAVRARHWFVLAKLRRDNYMIWWIVSMFKSMLLLSYIITSPDEKCCALFWICH